MAADNFGVATFGSTAGAAAAAVTEAATLLAGSIAGTSATCKVSHLVKLSGRKAMLKLCRKQNA